MSVVDRVRGVLGLIRGPRTPVIIILFYLINFFLILFVHLNAPHISKTFKCHVSQKIFNLHANRWSQSIRLVELLLETTRTSDYHFLQYYI